MHILQSEEARLPAIPLHMYRTVHDTAPAPVTGGVLSSSINTGDANLSSKEFTN
jgi:hypothetical protein